MNAPERSASFLLDEDNGEVKIEYAADTKVSVIWLVEQLNTFFRFVRANRFWYHIESRIALFHNQVTNAGTFRLNKEDHTIGNLFRCQLLRDPSVRFAGYHHPHPLVHYLNLKIQTNNSTVSPVEVLSSAIEDLANETDHLITQFQDAVETWRRENGAETQF